MGEPSNIEQEMATAELRAWDSLSKYKFLMFGYHAAWWVKLNRMGGFKRPNPFTDLVRLARGKYTPAPRRQAQLDMDHAQPRPTLAERLRAKHKAGTAP